MPVVIVSRFECPMSRSLTITTVALLAFLVLLLGGVAAIFWWAGRRSGWPSALVWVGALSVGVTALFTLGVVCFTWLLSPRSVVITDDAVVVQRPLWPIEIPLGEIRSVRLLSRGDLARSIRTAGAAGMFAQIGRFHSPALGNFRMYLRNEADGVVIEAGERFVLSPHPADRFVQELAARLARRAGLGGTT
jgi:PH (Pleckstrin Homology) domain-containing protein